MTRTEYGINGNDYFDRLERIATALLAAYASHSTYAAKPEVDWAIRAAAGLIETIDGLRNRNDETS